MAQGRGRSRWGVELTDAAMHAKILAQAGSGPSGRLKKARAMTERGQ